MAAVAMPLIMPPPLMGTMMASRSGTCGQARQHTWVQEHSDEARMTCCFPPKALSALRFLLLPL